MLWELEEPLWVPAERGISEESQRICGEQELRILLSVLQLSPGSRCLSASPAPRSSQGCSLPPSEWEFGNFGGLFLAG